MRSRQKLLVIETLPIGALSPDPQNPRKHNLRQIKQLARSIRAFGFNVPLLIDADNTVIAGHCRLAAAEREGLAEVPVIRLEHLSEMQVRAFRIADNRLAEVAVWDEQALAEILAELAPLDLDFDLEATGFSMAEIDLHIEGLGNGEDPAPDDADDLAGAAAGPPVSKLGDLWQLDRHRLLCGNASEEAAFTTLLEGKRAAMVFTDPPYNVPIEGHVSGAGKIRHREFAMASGELSDAQFAQFLSSVLRLLSRHSTSGSLHYVCMDWRHIRLLLEAGQAAYREQLNLCVWVKSNAGLGSFYRSGHELVAVFKNGRAAHRNNIELGRFGRNRTNVWHYAGMSGFGGGGEEGDLSALHPTVKPVALIADAILDCTARGDLILDPFLGSGSTLLAAHRVGRICRAIEIDPLYVDTAIRRWQRFTGGTALHARSGEPFDKLEQRAAAQHG